MSSWTFDANTFFTGNTANLIYLNAYSGGGIGTGYFARVKAWSSALTLAELEAERTCGSLAAKAGATFYAGLDVTGDYGGVMTDAGSNAAVNGQ